MTQQLTPPPTPAAPTPAPAARGTGIARTITLVGIVIVVVAVVLGVIAAFTGRGAASLSRSVGVTGITELAVEAAATEFDVSFSADATEARLDVTTDGWQGVRDWTLERRGDTLRVADAGGWRPLNWFTFGTDEHATLVLPAELEGRLDVNLDVSAGGLVFTGDVRDAELTVSAGELEFTGAADAIDAEVSAGSALVRVSDARTISAEVSAGGFDLIATGTAPEDTEITVSAGDATVTLPDVLYAVTGDVSAGDRTIGLREDPSSPRTVHVSVSAGDVTLNPGD